MERMNHWATETEADTGGAVGVFECVFRDQVKSLGKRRSCLHGCKKAREIQYAYAKML